MGFWELGLMRTLGTQSAFGATVLLTTRFSLGFKARYRRWLSRMVSLDVAPGVTLYREGNTARTPSFTGHVGVNDGDWLAWAAWSRYLELRPTPLSVPRRRPSPNPFWPQARL